MTNAMKRVLRAFAENKATEVLGQRAFPYPHHFRMKHENPLLDFDVEETTVEKLVTQGYVKPSIEGVGDRLHFTLTEKGADAFAKLPPKKVKGAG